MTSTSTADYRTKSLVLEADNPKVEGYWPLALDIGYSSVKGISPNSFYVFPSYAKNLGLKPALYGEQGHDEILYRDSDTGEIWRVGSSAQRTIDIRDTNDSQLELFGRDRYFSRMFEVLLRTGLAMGIRDNSFSAYAGEPIVIETGLPPAYLEEDRKYLVSAFSGTHKFAIKTAADKRYRDIELTISKKNISVMSQPEGTLMNLATDNHARSLPRAKQLFQSNILIFDAGFGTLDLFDILHRTINSRETSSEFGMREVLSRTSQRIRRETGVIIRPSAMQNSLESGTVMVKKRVGLTVSSQAVSIEEWLYDASKQVCEEAVAKIMNMYSGLFQYDYLVLTGGTCTAWEHYIREYFAAVEGLSVIMGNENCPDVDLIFCNARGYYMYLIKTLRKRLGKQG